MVMKLLQTETDIDLTVQRVMYNRHYTITLKKTSCVGCNICKTVCPREAIELIKSTKNESEEISSPTITIDQNKCSFCGICVAICPFGALSLTINGENIIPILDKESFPKLTRNIVVDISKCPAKCNECERACPFNLITVSTDNSNGLVKVDIDTDRCPGCKLCSAKCPYDAIKVKRIILGSIWINPKECRENCIDCVNVCPIPGVLNLSSSGEIQIDEQFCVYCGVCKVVCPVNNALYLQRSKIHHSPIRSGAWNKALENLTSTKDMTKELRSKGTAKLRESVRKRFE